MVALLKLYFDIAFLMRKPQDLPAGEQQMYIGIALNLVTYVIALSSFEGVGSAVFHAIIDIGFTGAILFAALHLTSHVPRFQQAFGAITGAGAILNMAAIPMLQIAVEPLPGTVNTLAVLSRFVLLVWSLSLVAHIVRHTFGIRMVASIGVAVLYYLFITSVLSAVLPAIDTQAETVSVMEVYYRDA